MMAIHGDIRMPNHSDAVNFFNELVIDLKRRELGLYHNPITMERIDDANKHIMEIERCQRPMNMYR